MTAEIRGGDDGARWVLLDDDGQPVAMQAGVSPDVDTAAADLARVLDLLRLGAA